jgi:hypothetical protein
MNAAHDIGIGEDSLALGCQSARAEARSLLPLELIAVAPRVEHALRAFARAHPENVAFIEKSLKFRFLVAQEFERLRLRSCSDDIIASKIRLCGVPYRARIAPMPIEHLRKPVTDASLGC